MALGQGDLMMTNRDLFRGPLQAIPCRRAAVRSQDERVIPEGAPGLVLAPAHPVSGLYVMLFGRETANVWEHHVDLVRSYDAGGLDG